MAGFRHRVRIEVASRAQDHTTGYMTDTWSTFADDVPANIEPLRARDRVAADQEREAVDTKITMRWIPGVVAEMRIVNPYDGDRIYNIRGVLPDPTQRRELVIECDSGLNKGQ